MSLDNNANGHKAGSIPILADSRHTIQLTDRSAKSILAVANTNVKLHPEVQKEWVEKRGYKAEWIAENIKWLDRVEASKRLGYDAQHDGHWIEGELGYSQFKPRTPFKDKQGRIAKYVSPKPEVKKIDVLLPRYPGKPKFWDDSEEIKKHAIVKNGIPCVGVTEGGPKAVSLCSNIGAAVGVPGCWNGTVLSSNKGRSLDDDSYELVDYLDYLYRAERFGLVILQDQDDRWLTKKNVNDAIYRLGDTAGGERIWVAMWDPALGKGVDDVIKAHGTAPLLEAIENALPFDEWAKIYHPETKKAKLRLILEHEYGKRLRFNLLKDEITVDGKPILSPSEVRRTGGKTTNWFNFQADCEELLEAEISENAFFNAVISAAINYSFHPVLDYLNHVKEQYKDTPHGAINQFCDLLGLQTTIERVQMEMHLIASVKRITDPGCKYDTVPVFFGAQGINKTTLWETLYGGEEYFTTLRVGDTDKDTIMLTHRYWAVEYGEIDVIYKKKEIEQVKANLSTREDTYRPPYERVNKSVPRSFVFVGSTNKPEFLLDDENRRFWMLEPKANPVIDLDKVRVIRDAVWAEAYQKAEAGAQYWFVRESQHWNEQEALSKRYQLSSSFYEQIIVALPKLNDAFSMTELCNQLGLTPSDQARFNQSIAKDLKLMGFTNEGFVGDKRLKRWRKADFNPQPSDARGASTSLQNETLTTSQSERGEIGFSNFERLNGFSKDAHPVEPITTPQPNHQSVEKMHFTPRPLSNLEPERLSEPEGSINTPRSPETSLQQGFGDSERGEEEKVTPRTPAKDKNPYHIEPGDFVMVSDEYSAYWMKLGQVQQMSNEMVMVKWNHKSNADPMDLAELVVAEFHEATDSHKACVRSVLGDFWCDPETHLLTPIA
jgi:hypothetical protein